LSENGNHYYLASTALLSSDIVACTILVNLVEVQVRDKEFDKGINNKEETKNAKLACRILVTLG